VQSVTIVDGRLVVADRPVPQAGPGEVLVRVHGAGLNRADLLQRAGGYPAPPGVPADIPGMEFAGVVETLGPDATGVALGDNVFGIVAGGAQAEYVVVHASHCAPVPAHLALVDAGGVPEAFITAHDAMVTQADVRAGEWMLVHAVGSGVGTTALQLAKALGVRVAGTARTSDKLARCTEMGLDVAIVPPTTDDGALDVDALAWQLVEATDGGIDVTLDLVGGQYLASAISAANRRGRIVCIGTIAGGRATIPVVGVLTKRLSIMGTVLRPRDVAEKAAATTAFVRDVLPLLEAGTVAPVVDAVIPLADVEQAYELVASDATFGKVILDCR
jgi:putative PIG3 family NAD(P)H quinone oxidoreductase